MLSPPLAIVTAATTPSTPIAGAIQEGASAYLKRQFRTIGMIVIPLAVSFCNAPV